MKGQLKKVFNQSAIYSVGNLANKIVGFLLLPLYTDHLTDTDYGMLGLLEATAMILVAVLSFRIPTAMIRWCSDTNDQNAQGSILFTSLISLLVISILINLTLQPFAADFAMLAFNKPVFTIFFQLLFISAGLEILNKLPLEFLRFKEKAGMFISINLIKLVIVLGLNIYLIAYLKWGIKGILVSQIAGHAFVLLANVVYMFKNMVVQFNVKAAKGMAAYGFPLVFSTLSAMLLSLADRYLLPYFHEYSDLGVYTLAYKVSSVTNVFLITSFQLGFLPIAFKRFRDNDFKPFLSKVLTYFSFLVIAFSLFLSFFSKELITTFAKDESFWLAYDMVPIIAFLFIFKAIQYVFTLSLHFTKNTRYNIHIVFLSLLANIVLNIFLIPLYDVYGAIAASILAGLLGLFYSYRLSERFFKVDYELMKIFKLVIIGIVFTVVLYFINPLDTWYRWTAKLGCVIAFLTLAVGIGYFDKNEINFVKQRVKNIF